MTRIPRFLLIPLLLAPSLAWGQVSWKPERDRVSLTVHTGARVPYTTGFMTIAGPGGADPIAVREERGGNPVVGVEGEVRVVGPFSLVAGGVYSRMGNGNFYVERDPEFFGAADFAVRYSADVWLAKAGASLRVEAPPSLTNGRNRPATDLHLAGAMVRQLDTNHPALNLGFRGALPLGADGGVEVVVGLEDYFVFWDHDALAPRMTELFQELTGSGPLGVDFLYDTSHVLLLRLGVSLRY